MYKVSYLLHLVDGADEGSAQKVANDLRALVLPATHRYVGLTLPGVFNGGDIIVNLHFEDRAAYERVEAEVSAAFAHPLIARSNHTSYQALSRDRTAELASGVYRALFLSVKRETPTDQITAFENEVVQMPRYIKAIKNWQFSRVDTASGDRPWTHVWEQEFASLEDLNGAYMVHPYHWARIDRWFDPECAEWIVDPLLCHSFAAFDQRVI